MLEKILQHIYYATATALNRMRLRHALNDFKRSRGMASKFPGERRSVTGTFSGDERLVYVDRDGSLQDYSYSLLGLSGIEFSRFGIRGEEIHWFGDEGEQRYVKDSFIVETIHEFDDWSVTQYDLTLGRAHVTHFKLTGNPPEGCDLVGTLCFGPDGREGQSAHLVHEDAIEVYHRNEHDFFAASPGISEVVGEIPERFQELLGPEPVDFPRSNDTDSYEEPTLSGIVTSTIPFENGNATLVSKLTKGPSIDRTETLTRLRQLLARFDTLDTWQTTGSADNLAVDDSLPLRRAIVADLRVLSLLSAPSGARIAGPDFDPFYANSGGYGYTWFRDDAEIARYLLGVDDNLHVVPDNWHAKAASFYCDAQLTDGTWPHRVWPREGTLAPGWANARLEADGEADYQADQTASVIGFLATYLRKRNSSNEVEIEETIERGVDALDAWLATDGLPRTSQNAWENMQGRFTHTAATFLEAYSTVGRSPVDNKLADHAVSQASGILEGLDALWTGDHYALRIADGERDDRFDSSTLALVSSFREYNALESLSERKRDRLVSHVTSLCDRLYRDTGDVRGLARFEGDDWRQRSQTSPKIWTVSTAWAANATAQLGTLLNNHDDDRADEQYRQSRILLSELLPTGSLTQRSGYLSEQVFDDGTPDCATPLGWSHAIRLSTIGHLQAAGELDVDTMQKTTDETSVAE